MRASGRRRVAHYGVSLVSFLQSYLTNRARVSVRDKEREKKKKKKGTQLRREILSNTVYLEQLVCHSEDQRGPIGLSRD